MKKYVFKPYDPIFPELFEREKQRIFSSLGNQVLIEHVGSTAVPRLGGKGIIDIAVAVRRDEMEAIALRLQELGYELKRVYSTADRLYFNADLEDPKETVRRYHLHLTYPDSKDWEDLISFRDYLRAHPDEAKRYAEMKEKAAFDVKEDGKKYRKMKEPFFERILKLCRFRKST